MEFLTFTATAHEPIFGIATAYTVSREGAALAMLAKNRIGRRACWVLTYRDQSVELDAKASFAHAEQALRTLRGA
jgi:hypothetical protein